MDEVAELIAILAGTDVGLVNKISYQEIFKKVTGLDPFIFCQQSYAEYAEKNNIIDAVLLCKDDHSMWLDFIFSYKIQPTLSEQYLCMVYGYPAILSFLARINPKDSAIADRFEVFVKGVEIGNGFFELSDPNEQENRFDQENDSRQLKKLRGVEKDQRFLDALRAGLPDCSGIALGLDRLLMVIDDATSLSDVIAFPFDRA
jgi:lysyl-tRNA synthetase class 2